MTIDTGNYQGVGLRGDEIIVLVPSNRMTRQEALLHAAWLVSIVGDDEAFKRVLQAVRSI